VLFGEYHFHCRFETDAVLPRNKGSTFRGVFGHALKQVVCALKRQTCETCLLKQSCVYALVFETEVAGALPAVSRMAAPPHPFVIEPPLDTRTDYPAGADFNFKLLLFGDINRLLPYFIYAFDRMGKIGIGKKINGRRGRCALDTVYHDKACIYSGANQILEMNGALPDLKLPKAHGDGKNPMRLQVHLKTPLRFKFRNRFNRDLPFHVLIRVALRRVSALFTAYNGGEPSLDYTGMVHRAERVNIIESSLDWFDWRRYSGRQDQKMLMGGMVGSIMYEGDLKEFMPLMDVAAQVHLGKQTSFGLGQVEVIGN
jgi:CRISPR/Cas system endoribonuclease Cas6 (RAMP superfamily)